MIFPHVIIKLSFHNKVASYKDSGMRQWIKLAMEEYYCCYYYHYLTLYKWLNIIFKYLKRTHEIFLYLENTVPQKTWDWDFWYSKI